MTTQDTSANSTYQLCSSGCTPLRDEENCQLKKRPLNLLMNSIVSAEYSVQINGSSLILHPIQSHTIHNSIEMICGGRLSKSVRGVTPYSSYLTIQLLTAAKHYIQSAYSDLLKINAPEVCKERKLSDKDAKNTQVKKEEPESSTELSNEDSLNTTFIKNEPESYKELSDEDSRNTTFIKKEPESYKDKKPTIYKIKIQFDVVCEIFCKAEVNEKTGHVSAVEIFKYKNHKITAREIKEARYLDSNKLQRIEGKVVHACDYSVADIFFHGIRSKLSSEFMMGKIV